jgi:hypothetical protein
LGQPIEEQLRPVAILDIGGMNDDGDQQPQRFYEEMPFSPVDFLARVVTMDPPFTVVFSD